LSTFSGKHPPFRPSRSRTLDLAGRGRVRFHEANEYILWQGEPHKLHVLVIQQGTVSLWDEADGEAGIKAWRGPGDLLGIERLNHAPWCLHSARSPATS
jgi:CRP-like cAMP-binding protein